MKSLLFLAALLGLSQFGSPYPTIQKHASIGQLINSPEAKAATNLLVPMVQSKNDAEKNIKSLVTSGIELDQIYSLTSRGKFRIRRATNGRHNSGRGQNTPRAIGQNIARPNVQSTALPNVQSYASAIVQDIARPSGQSYAGSGGQNIAGSSGQNNAGSSGQSYASAINQNIARPNVQNNAAGLGQHPGATNNPEIAGSNILKQQNRVSIKRVKDRHVSKHDLKTQEGRRASLRAIKAQEGQDFTGNQNQRLTMFNNDRDLQNALDQGRRDLENDQQFQPHQTHVGGQESFTLINTDNGKQAFINIGPLNRNRGDVIFQRIGVSASGKTTYRVFKPVGETAGQDNHVVTFYHAPHANPPPKVYSSHLEAGEVGESELETGSSFEMSSPSS